MTTARLCEPLLKVAYAALFVGVLPALLARWAERLDRWVRLPVPDAAWAGAVVVAVGVAIMTAGTTEGRHG